jgi:Single-strand binding protein family
MNACMFTGNLGHSPKLRTPDDGTAMFTFSLAV